MERLIHIDILKGIAIILVVMGHMFVPYTDYLNSTINQLIYSVHMPLFFFLSGYVFKKEQNIGRMIIKKTIGLLLPFFTFSALYCFCFSISYIDLLTKTEMHHGFWFTLVLWEIIIISIFATIREGGRFVLANLVIISILLIITKFSLIPEPIKTILSTDKVAKFYMFFFLGRIVRNSPRVNNVFHKQYLYVLCCIIFFYCFIKNGYDLQKVNVYSFIFPFCGIIVLTNIVKSNLNKFNYKGILQYIGKNSLEIYLIHLFFLTQIPPIIINSYNVLYLQFFVLLLFSLCNIIMSILVAHLIHHSSFLKFLFLGKGNIMYNILSHI